MGAVYVLNLAIKCVNIFNLGCFYYRYGPNCCTFSSCYENESKLVNRTHYLPLPLWVWNFQMAGFQGIT